jgi:5-methylcytosine-specific restriction protein B
MYGIRAKSGPDGSVYWSGEPGYFLEFCDKARQLSADTPAVLIIDELNRANLPRVFGELMYLLEYRDRSVRLTSSRECFSVPSNIYIIGTMNTADRSIAQMDHGLSRRFSFFFLAPDYEDLSAYLTRQKLPPEALIAAWRKVNAVIGNPNYQVGISFFLRDGTALKTTLPEIWQTEIEHYLEDHFIDKPNMVDQLRWAQLRKQELKDWPGDLDL